MIRSWLAFSAFGAFVFGALGASGCSSDDPSDAYPTVDSFCSGVAEQECQAVAASCGATLEACKQKRTPVCSQAATEARNQGRTYAPGAADECITKTRDLYQARTIDPKKEKEQQETCARVMQGQRDKSQACTTDYDCKGTMVCDKKVCADKVTKSEKDPCNNPGEVCATGSYCGTQGDLKFCLAKKSANELCDANAPCKEDLRCTGTCKPKYVAGEVCGSNDECADTAPYCDPLQKRCIAKSFAAGTTACKDFGGF